MIIVIQECVKERRNVWRHTHQIQSFFYLLAELVYSVFSLFINIDLYRFSSLKRKFLLSDYANKSKSAVQSQLAESMCQFEDYHLVF